ncbi:hypothetical protein K523DRAFT_325422 [Schizophyllum commune Tattone D]|nr:hypothetical protein K523DRAFT_325422 [Schizophyllum commune Tattone D]
MPSLHPVPRVNDDFPLSIPSVPIVQVIYPRPFLSHFSLSNPRSHICIRSAPRTPHALAGPISLPKYLEKNSSSQLKNTSLSSADRFAQSISSCSDALAAVVDENADLNDPVVLLDALEGVDFSIGEAENAGDALAENAGGFGEAEKADREAGAGDEEAPPENAAPPENDEPDAENAALGATAGFGAGATGGGGGGGGGGGAGGAPALSLAPAPPPASGLDPRFTGGGLLPRFTGGGGPGLGLADGLGLMLLFCLPGSGGGAGAPKEGDPPDLGGSAGDPPDLGGSEGDPPGLGGGAGRPGREGADLPGSAGGGDGVATEAVADEVRLGGGGGLGGGGAGLAELELEVCLGGGGGGGGLPL